MTISVTRHFNQSTVRAVSFNLQQAIDAAALSALSKGPRLDIDDSPELRQVSAPKTSVPENPARERGQTPPSILKRSPPPTCASAYLNSIFNDLKPRAQQAARLLVTSYTTDQDIAGAMGIKTGSIRKLMTDLFDATSTDNRVELALYIVRHPEFEKLLLSVPITKSQKRGLKK